MNLRRLSEQVALLKNPQRSDQFVRQFRNAVRDGVFDATEIPERFELPKQYAKRGQDASYSKSAKEMVFEVNPAFEAWFNDLDDPEPVPRDTSYASLIESSHPIVVQHTRLDSRDPHIALLSTVAFAATS